MGVGEAGGSRLGPPPIMMGMCACVRVCVLFHTFQCVYVFECRYACVCALVCVYVLCVSVCIGVCICKYFCEIVSLSVFYVDVYVFTPE